MLQRKSAPECLWSLDRLLLSTSRKRVVSISGEYLEHGVGEKEWLEKENTMYERFQILKSVIKKLFGLWWDFLFGWFGVFY